MKNITFFFFAFFFLAFFNAANSQSGGQSPVSGLGYAPDSNYIIISKLYRGRNGVAVWMHKDSIDWLEGFTPGSVIFVGANGTPTESNYRFHFDSLRSTLMIGANNNTSPTRSIHIYKHLANTAWASYVYIQNDTINSANSSVAMSTTNVEGVIGGNEWNFFSSQKNPTINFIGNIINPSTSKAGTGTAGMSFGMRDRTTGSVLPLTTKPAFIFYNGTDGFTAPYNMCMIVGAGRRTGAGETNITGGHDVEFPFYTTSRNNYATDPNVSHIYYPDQYGHMLLTLFSNGNVTNPSTASTSTLQTALNSIYSAATTGVNIFNSNGSLTANRTLAGTNFNLDFTGMGNFTATGSGSATYRFNLYPSSSLPVLLEQTSAGDTAYLQLRASLGRATLRATQDIYLEAASSVFVSTLEGSSTGIVSARPTGELIRRERAFVNASINTDTFTVALSPTEINLPFNDDVSEGFNVSGDSLIYTGTDTAYFEIGYYQNIEFLESATGTYRLNLSVYQNGVNIPRSEIEHLIYFQNTTTEPILTAGKTFIVQLINGDVLNIRQSGTTGIDTAIHNLSITANKIE